MSQSEPIPKRPLPPRHQRSLQPMLGTRTTRNGAEAPSVCPEPVLDESLYGPSASWFHRRLGKAWAHLGASGGSRPSGSGSGQWPREAAGSRRGRPFHARWRGRTPLPSSPPFVCCLNNEILFCRGWVTWPCSRQVPHAVLGPAFVSTVTHMLGVVAPTAQLGLGVLREGQRYKVTEVVVPGAFQGISSMHLG